MYAIFVKATDLLDPSAEVGPRAEKEDPAIAKLLRDYADVFPDKLPDGLPPARGVEHKIELKPGSHPPPPRGLRHQSSKDLAVFEEYTRSLIKAGHIRVSQSPYGATALIVRKSDGTPRVVVDYRALNDQTIKNRYPLPLMDELFDRVHGATEFTRLDLRSGFHQIVIAPEDVEKTAFRTRYGSYEYMVLPMGLCNAPGTFMQLMNETFRDLLDRCVLVFLDDILVFSRSKAEHVAHVEEVLIRLRKQKLYAKLSKCEFMKKEVEFLGHRIGAAGLSVSQDKVAAVRAWPVCENVHDVRSFTGFTGFYRKFIKDYSLLALPLTELTKEKNAWVWGTEQQHSFEALKEALCTAPVLLIPNPALPYTLNCDACKYAVGGTLQQDHGNGLQPVAYLSRKLKAAELNWDTREKEFFALVECCRHWRHYLHNEHPFKLLTDHDSLKYHKTMPNISGKIARWIEKMSEHDYTIDFIPGVKNIVADALSRRADLKDAGPLERLAAVQLIWAGELVRLHASNSAAAIPTEYLAAARAMLTPQEARDQRLSNRRAAEESLPPAVDRPAADKHGAIVMPSQCCTGTTKRGLPCKQRTAKGQYCWNHLSSVCGLRIKKSANLPGAGLGLHASRVLEAGTRIDYTGDIVPLSASKDGGTYFLQLTKKKAIDAARTNAGEGRWVNDPRGMTDAAGRPLEANSDFVLYTPPGKPRQACVRTRRRIERGEEILIKYGQQYWRFHLQPAIVKRRAKRVVAKAMGRKSFPKLADDLPGVEVLTRDGRRHTPAAAAGAAPVMMKYGGHYLPGPEEDEFADSLNREEQLYDEQLAVVNQTRVTSPLTQQIRAAAAQDPVYVAALESPPPGREACAGILFEGGVMVVPDVAALRTRLLAECHDTVTGGHTGRDKMLAAVKRRFTWAGLATDVERYVATCDACQRNKPSQQLAPGLLMPLPLPERPCLAWTQDAVSGLPKTKRGNDAIQVYVERLCKVKHFAATRTTDGAAELARSFVHTVVRAHGVPEEIVSDRDPRFTAHYYAELTKLLGITLKMSTSRHPQTDGQSEREVRSVITTLRAYCNAHQDDWDEHLDMLELGFNCSEQASTKQTPYQMLYGMHPRLPIDAALAPIVPRNPAAIDRAQRMRDALRVGRDYLLSAQERQARNADRHRRDAAFAVGDAVMLSTEGLQLRGHSNKLCSRFIGPFEVTAIVNRNAYTLALPPQLQALHPTFNIDKLKKYRDGRAAFPDRPLVHARPPPVATADSNGDAVYEVERITAQRKVGRSMQYLVAWKGYPSEESTWERRDTLLPGAADALADFENSQRD